MEFRTPNTVNTRWKHFMALSLGFMGCIVHPMFRIVDTAGTFWQSVNCVISILNYVIEYMADYLRETSYLRENSSKQFDNHTARFFISVTLASFT